MSEKILLKRMELEGFTLEDETRRLLKSNDFDVVENISLESSINTKADIDIIAYRINSAVIIQCKGSPINMKLGLFGMTSEFIQEKPCVS